MKKYLLITIIISSLALSMHANATDMTDIMGMLKQIYGINVDQLADLNDLDAIEGQLKNLSQDQLDQLTQQLTAMTGNYGYGKLNNSDDDVSARQWSPETWQDALNGLSGSNPERYQELVDDYQQDNPSLSETEMAKGADDAYTQDYERQVAVNQSASVQATYEFNDLQQHIDNIKTLSQEIDNSNNEKSTEDLNARINSEVAYLTVEEIKMLAVMNEQYSQQVSHQLMERTNASTLNQLPTA